MKMTKKGFRPALFFEPTKQPTIPTPISSQSILCKIELNKVAKLDCNIGMNYVSVWWCQCQCLYLCIAFIFSENNSIFPIFI